MVFVISGLPHFLRRCLLASPSMHAVYTGLHVGLVGMPTKTAQLVCCVDAPLCLMVLTCMHAAATYQVLLLGTATYATDVQPVDRCLLDTACCCPHAHACLGSMTLCANSSCNCMLRHRSQLQCTNMAILNSCACRHDAVCAAEAASHVPDSATSQGPQLASGMHRVPQDVWRQDEWNGSVRGCMLWFQSCVFCADQSSTKQSQRVRHMGLVGVAAAGHVKYCQAASTLATPLPPTA
jgi:hypothetical protein